MDRSLYKTQNDDGEQPIQGGKPAGSSKILGRNALILVCILAIIIVGLAIALGVTLSQSANTNQQVPVSQSVAAIHGKPIQSTVCSQPPPIDDGKPVIENVEQRYFEGDVVFYQCNDGFNMSGLNFITCDSTAPWQWPNATLPVCKRMCSTPPSIGNGKVIDPYQRSSYLENDRVSYQCNNGYSLIGSDAATCHSSKVWKWNKNSFPFCRRICSTPPTLSNGRLLNASSSYSEDDQITYQCNNGFNLIGSKVAFCQSDGTWTWNQATPPVCLRNVRATSCKELFAAGYTSNGVYTIYPFGGSGLRIYCDQESDGGGWEVIQRRLDGSVDFYRNWSSYVNGFGNISAEYWFGLDNIHRITTTSSQELRIDLGDFNNIKRYAKYRNFRLESAGTNYTLNISGYSGNGGDGLSTLNGLQFSTFDRDNDESAVTHCSVKYGGAWWFRACYVGASSLNGEYLRGPHDNLGGVSWIPWRNRYSLKFSEMKIRPTT